MKRLRRPRTLAAAALAAAALGLVLVGPTLVAAQTTTTPEDERWPELTPAACEERAANAELPRMTAFLDELVADGVIDQGQADEIERRGRERDESACIGRILYQPGQAVAATAEVTGTEPRDVLRALRNGATLADYGAQYGVSAEQLSEAIMVDSRTRAAELVASGELDQARADELLLAIEQRVSEGIHGTRQDRQGRWHGLRDGIGDATNALAGLFGS